MCVVTNDTPDHQVIPVEETSLLFGERPLPRPTRGAILETTLAVLIAISLIVTGNTLVFAACTATLSPFMLLRTDTSCLASAVWFYTQLRTLRFRHRAQWWYVTIEPIIIVVLATLARFYGTVYPVFNAPQSICRAIPRNWTHIVLCTSLDDHTEMLPGLATIDPQVS
jgi:hypothetical protein